VITVPETAAEMIGDISEFIFLAQADVEVPLALGEVWDRLEGDYNRALLGELSDRFLERRIIDELDGGYACATVSRGKVFRRRQGFTSIVHRQRPATALERQLGTKTDLLCITDYGAVPIGTKVTYTQSYLAKASSFETVSVLGVLRTRAEAIVTARVGAIARLCADA
jgi:hypothetical protein